MRHRQDYARYPLAPCLDSLQPAELSGEIRNGGATDCSRPRTRPSESHQPSWVDSGQKIYRLPAQGPEGWIRGQGGASLSALPVRSDASSGRRGLSLVMWVDTIRGAGESGQHC